MHSTTQSATPELRQWIIEQAGAGHTPESVLTAMVQSGWNEDVALSALEETLQGFLADRTRQLEQQQQQPPPQQPPQQQLPEPTKQKLPPIMTAPDPGLEDSPSVVRVGDRDIRVVLQMRNPRVVVFADFLSDSECDALRALAEPRLARSETVDTHTGGSEINEARTSAGMFFSRGENPVIQAMEQRIAALLGWPLENGEGVQVLHYRPGAEYKPHYDYFDPAQPGTATILKRGGQRVGTVVMYLNTPEAGGGTTFPDVQLEVAPIKGHAVFFGYDRADPSSRSLHGGAPVRRGEKWVATKWLRQGRFD